MISPVVERKLHNKIEDIQLSLDLSQISVEFLAPLQYIIHILKRN